MKPQDENHIRHTFDCYCKKVLKYTARDYYEAQRKHSEREIPLDTLSEQELSRLVTADVYSVDETVFDVLGEAIGIVNDDLADALQRLPKDKRDIVILSYFCNMTDGEIAKHMNMVRRTVAYRRASTLQELKKIMEEKDND